MQGGGRAVAPGGAVVQTNENPLKLGDKTINRLELGYGFMCWILLIAVKYHLVYQYE